MRPMELPAALQGRDIVCVGFADWDTELWTNQHHLMSRLAASNRVLFVESLGLRRPQLAGRDLRRIARRLRRGLRRRARATGCTCSRRWSCPLHAQRGRARRSTAACCRPSSRRAARRLGMRDRSCGPTSRRPRRCSTRSTPRSSSTTASTTSPPTRGIDAASFRAAEARFARARRPRARQRAGARRAHARRSRDNVLDAPNVADTELFAGALEREPDTRSTLRFAALPEPRLVFTGAISARQARHPAAGRARPRPPRSTRCGPG